MDYLWTDKKRTIFGLPISFTRYSLTEERLFIETGFLNKIEDEVRLYRIMDISLRVSLQRRTLAASPPLSTKTLLVICSLVNPHIAGQTTQSLRNVGTCAWNDIQAVLAGETPKYPFNKPASQA